MITRARRLVRSTAAAAAAGAAAPLVVAALQTARVTAWGWFWLTWICVALGVELYWVFVNAANTLSRQVWGVEGIDFAHPLDFAEWTPAHWAIAVVIWLFFAWLSVHFPFGWLR